MIKRCLLFFAVFCAFAGCATSGSDIAQSEKTIDFSSGLSSGRFLTATGIGETDAEARKMAKAEMSAIFESRIESQIDSNVKLVTSLENGEDVKKKTEANIKIKSNVQLQGVEIRKAWYDEKSRMYYALAALDKFNAREQWSDRLAKLENDISAKLERLEKTQSLLFKLESVKKLYSLMVEKETIVNRLRVIGFSTANLSPHNSVSTMEMATSIKQKMLLLVEITGDQANEVVGEISERLTRSGYTLTPNKKKATIVISGTVKTEPVKMENAEWKFSRATISITVSEPLSNNEAIKINKNVRKGHISHIEASRKAAMSAAKKISDVLLEFFGV